MLNLLDLQFLLNSFNWIRWVSSKWDARKISGIIWDCSESSLRDNCSSWHHFIYTKNRRIKKDSRRLSIKLLGWIVCTWKSLHVFCASIDVASLIKISLQSNPIPGKTNLIRNDISTLEIKANSKREKKKMFCVLFFQFFFYFVLHPPYFKMASLGFCWAREYFHKANFETLFKKRGREKKKKKSSWK